MRLKSKFEAWAGIIVGGREARSAIAELEKTRELIREGDMRHFFLDRIKNTRSALSTTVGEGDTARPLITCSEQDSTCVQSTLFH